LSLAGCRDSETDKLADVKLQFAMQPDPPKVGPTMAIIELADKDGTPLKGASVELEGNMNHAGMKPVFASAKETEPGKYEASLELTMGGDWYVLVKGTLADGRKLKRKINVPGVKSR
jgi:hypothetical protein